MKTTLRLTASLVALSAVLGALPAASASPLSVERIIAADQANDDIVLASSDANEKRKLQDANDEMNGEGDNDGEDGNDDEGGEGGEGGDGGGAEGGDND